MQALPQSIDEVLAALDEVIETAIRENTYLGLFAYLYRRVTAQIKEEVAKGRFEDNPRMQAFDIVFANLYIDAYRKYIAGEPTSQSWQFAFDCKQDRLTFTQHLLMGMNAHINLDLAIAASTVMEGKRIEHIKNDFHLVNDILASLTKEMQLRLGKVSPLLFLLDWLGKKSDEQLVNFSIKVARKQSWLMAQQLWSLQAATREQQIKQLDATVHLLSQRIKQPKLRTSKWVLRLISTFESKDIAHVLERLRAQL